MKFSEYQEYLSPALAKSTDLILESGKGMYVTDINGDTYQMCIRDRASTKK